MPRRLTILEVPELVPVPTDGIAKMSPPVGLRFIRRQIGVSELRQQTTIVLSMPTLSA